MKVQCLRLGLVTSFSICHFSFLICHCWIQFEAQQRTVDLAPVGRNVYRPELLSLTTNAPLGAQCRFLHRLASISISLLTEQDNARHHPRPHPSFIRDFVEGRRVHAVVRHSVI
jgi:hypothetical protein